MQKIVATNHLPLSFAFDLRKRPKKVRPKRGGLKNWYGYPSCIELSTKRTHMYSYMSVGTYVHTLLNIKCKR